MISIIKEHERLLMLVVLLLMAGCGAPTVIPSPAATAAALLTASLAPTASPSPTPIEGPTHLLDTGSGAPRLSDDGRWVAYLKYLSPNVPQAALLDRQTGEATILSVPPGGTPSSSGAIGASISGDGLTAAFFGFDPTLEPDRDHDCAGQPGDRYCGTLYIYDVPTGAMDHVAVGRTWPEHAAIDISGDGQTIVFGAGRALALPDGTYITDRKTGHTDQIDPRVSVETAISANGEVIAYVAQEDGGLVLFLYERKTKISTRIATVEGLEADKATIGRQFMTFNVSLSADGRYTAFVSTSPELAKPTPECRPHYEGEFPICGQVYVFDRDTGGIEMVSLTNNGQASNATNQNVSLSGDGRFVAFTSFAINLAGSFDCLDGDYCPQVYVRDRQTKKTTQVSTGMGGQPPNGYSVESAISGNGRWLAYTSLATNLIQDGVYGIYVTDVFDLLGIMP